MLAALKTEALKLLRLAGYDSICDDLHAVMHDIMTLFAMAMQQLRERPS